MGKRKQRMNHQVETPKLTYQASEEEAEEEEKSPEEEEETLTRWHRMNPLELGEILHLSQRNVGQISILNNQDTFLDVYLVRGVLSTWKILEKHVFPSALSYMLGFSWGFSLASSEKIPFKRLEEKIRTFHRKQN